MKLIVTLERDESGMIVVECPAIPGCVFQGATEAEPLANIREAIEGCLEARAANGMYLTSPVPTSLRDLRPTSVGAVLHYSTDDDVFDEMLEQ